MLTKKEKVLVQPWIDTRFQAHRSKVRGASAAIDVRAPAAQPHVAVKLKKTQRELERQRDIVRENGRLLQRLGQIMNTNRLDNFWRQSRPTFLNREPIRSTNRPKTSANRMPSQDVSAVPSAKSQTSSRSSAAMSLRASTVRCPTCSGRPTQRNQVIPEERVPWAPPKISANVKLNATNGRVPQCCIYCC